MPLPLIPGEERMGAQFHIRVGEVASRLGMNPDDLLRVMSFETGGSFAPDIRNKAGSGATGLIQFLPSTAQGLGTTPEALSRMTPEQQLDVVEKYLTPYRGRMHNLKDAYMAVLYPDAVGKGESTVLFQQGTRAYEQNAGLDVQKKGHVTVGDAVATVRRFLGIGGGVAEAETLDQEITREIARARLGKRDDLAPEYVADRNTALDAEMAQEMAKLRPPPMPETAAATAAGALPPGGPTGGPAVPGAPEAPSGGLVQRLGRDALQVLGGARDAFVQTFKAVDEFNEWLTSQTEGILPRIPILDPGTVPGAPTVAEAVPEVPKADTIEGDLIRGATQFITAFVPATNLVKGMGVAGRVTSSMLAGALTDFAAFDPHAPRLSNLLAELPAPLRNPLTVYLAAKADDSAALGRFKNALEGLGLGALVEGVVAAASALKQMRAVRQTVAESVPEGAVRATVLGETPPPRPPGMAPIAAVVEEGAPAGLGVGRRTVPVPSAPGEAAPATVRIAQPSPATKTAASEAMEAEAARTPRPAGGLAQATDEEIAQAMSLRPTPTTIHISDETAAKLSQSEVVTLGPATREHAQQFQTLTASGAAEALPTSGRFLHINFDKIQTGDDLKQTIATVAEVMKAETDVQRRGVQTTADTLAKAAQSPYRELDRVLGIGPGTTLAAEDAVAVRQVWLASAERLHGLSQELVAGNLAVADDWLKQFIVTANVHTKVAGITAEAGRTFRVFGVEMASTEQHFLDHFGTVLAEGWQGPESQLFRSVGAQGASQDAMHLAQQMAGVTTPQQLATAAMALEQQYTPQQLARLSQQQRLAAMLIQLRTPQQLATFMTQAQGITRKDMFLEVWYGSLLSAPPTHVANVLDGALRTLWAIPERYFTTVTGHPREIAQNFQAANAYTYGLKQGLQEAWQYAANAFRSGTSAFGASGKLPYQAVPALTAQNLGIEGSVLGHFADGLGTFARLSGRGLLAADEFFKVINYRAQLHEGAFRQATSEGYTGMPLAQRITALVKQEAEPLKDRASAWAQYQTLGQELGAEGAAFENLGRFTQKIAEGTEQWLPAKIILPFIKTPFNIVRSGLERVPLLGNMSANVNAQLMAGGAEGALARSKMALGGLTMGLFGWLAAEGAITGKAPADPGQRATWERLGIQPYSIWVPALGKYVAYNRIDAVGLPLGLAADFVQIARDTPMESLESLAGGMLGAIFNSVTSKTWLKRVADVIDAVTPGRGETAQESGAEFERFVGNLLGSYIPAGLTLLTRTLDPQQHQVRSLLDSMLSRLPGMSTWLAPSLDLWGRPRLRPEPLGPDLVSPFMSRDYTADAVDEELYRQGTPIRMPQRTIAISRPGAVTPETIELTPQQYNRYVELSAGKGAATPTSLKEALRTIMDSDVYKTQLSDGPQGGKSDLILHTIQEYRRVGEAQLRQEDPAIEKLLERKAISKALGSTKEGQRQLQQMNLQVGAPR